MRRRPFVDDPAGQLAFEAAARRDGMTIDREIVGRRLCYRLPVEVPIYDDERIATIAFDPGDPQAPSVYVDGPRCLRHRYPDDAICMWLPRDPPSKRWVLSEGLLELATHVKLHTYCEAECRAGKPWPKEEAPGRHPRKRSCPSCRGKGR